MGQGTAPGAIPGPGLVGGGSQVRFCRYVPPPSVRSYYSSFARVCRCLPPAARRNEILHFSRNSALLSSHGEQSAAENLVLGTFQIDRHALLFGFAVECAEASACGPREANRRQGKPPPPLMIPRRRRRCPSSSSFFSFCPSLPIYRPPPSSPAFVQPDDLLGMFDSSPSQQSAGAAGVARPIPRSPPVHAAPMSHMAGAGVGAGGGFGMGAHRPAVRNDFFLVREGEGRFRGPAFVRAVLRPVATILRNLLLGRK